MGGLIRVIEMQKQIHATSGNLKPTSKSHKK